MRKKLLDAPPEAGAITTYTADLARRLRGSVPGERADEIVREAEAHLHDQADAIAKASEANMPRQEAETRAVAAFTPPVTFARGMARSAVETRFSRAWYATGKVATALSLCGLVAGCIWDGTVDFHTSRGHGGSSFSGACYLLLWPTLCLCAFFARRPQTRHLLYSFALASAFLFVYAGCFYAMRPQSGVASEYSVSRLQARNQYKSWRDTRLHAKRDEERLTAGLKIYRAKNSVVPDELKAAQGKGYIVPVEILPDMGRADSARRDMGLAHTKRRDACYFYPFDTKSPETVPTFAEARARWLNDGPEYLAQAQYEQKHVLDDYEEPVRAASQQTGFSARTGWWWAANRFYEILCPIALDLLFAKLGRAVYIKCRARHERKASHA